MTDPLPATVDCGYCHGRGVFTHADGMILPCPICDAQGKVAVQLTVTPGVIARALLAGVLWIPILAVAF